MIELTTSGLTHGFPIIFPDSLGDKVLNYVWLTDTYSQKQDRFMLGRNFGNIEFEFDENDPMNTRISL